MWNSFWSPLFWISGSRGTWIRSVVQRPAHSVEKRERGEEGKRGRRGGAVERWRECWGGLGVGWYWPATSGVHKTTRHANTHAVSYVQVHGHSHPQRALLKKHVHSNDTSFITHSHPHPHSHTYRMSSMFTTAFHHSRPCYRPFSPLLSTGAASVGAPTRGDAGAAQRLLPGLITMERPT